MVLQQLNGYTIITADCVIVRISMVDKIHRILTKLQRVFIVLFCMFYIPILLEPRADIS